MLIFKNTLIHTLKNNDMKNNDTLKSNGSNNIIFINSINDNKVCYSTVTTFNRLGMDFLKRVLDDKRYSTIESIRSNYTLLGNYPKDLIND